MMRNNIDFPITEKDEDLLEYNFYTQNVLKEILSDEESYQRGLTVGLSGNWGSGKSSFINLMKAHIRENSEYKNTIVEFNPWSISNGTEKSILLNFFREVGSQFEAYAEQEHDRKVAEKFAQYGDILSFLNVVPGAKGVLKSLKTRAKQYSAHSASEAYKELEELFTTLEKPIFIFVDDVDRLTKKEVRELFKLIRQTAFLPNLIYVVAYDADLVAEALDGPGTPGYLYLQKIIQFDVNMPKISFEKMSEFLFENNFKDGKEPSKYTLAKWQEATPYLSKLIRNFRDVKKISTAVQMTQKRMISINLVDLIILETLRKMETKTFNNISNNYTYFTSAYLGSLKYQTDADDAIKILKNTGSIHSKHLINIILPGYLEIIKNPKQTHNNSRINSNDIYLKEESLIS
jgi:predicted KAP-like P-loop ATPase